MGRGLADGDWTVGERAQLREIAAALTGDRTGSNLMFGLADDGDPWCVATDDREEVVLHIARIGGRVIIHRMFDGMVREASDVFTAAAFIQQRPPARVGGVQPILADVLPNDAPFTLIAGAQHLHDDAQAPLRAEMAPRYDPIGADALDRAAAFNASDELTSPAAEAPLHVFAEPAAPHAPLRVVTAEIIQFQPAAAAAAIAAAAAPLPAFAAPEPAMLQPTPVAAAPVDGEPAGGGGDPPTIAPPGAEPGVENTGNKGGGADSGVIDPAGFTRFDGDNGADEFAMGSRVVANGGQGADIFIINWRPAAASVSAGVILDYNEGQGDRLQFANDANPPRIVSVTDQVDLSAFVTPDGSSFVGASINGRRIGFDMDGDGREDVHIVIGGDSNVTNLTVTGMAANLRGVEIDTMTTISTGELIVGLAAAVWVSDDFF